MLQEIPGRERVEGIRVTPAAGGEVRIIPVTGVFVEIGLTPDSALAGNLTEMNTGGGDRDRTRLLDTDGGPVRCG